jgi:rifampicin phosphotransferase
MQPYPDGRWSLSDHPPVYEQTLWCRGNVGEVFPNVMTPLTFSLYFEAIGRGQAISAREWGMVTAKQYAAFDPSDAWATGVFGGYLYGNVTLARTAVARSPGLTVEMVDEQMFGLSDAPDHRRGKGERDVRAAARTVRKLLATLGRPDEDALRGDQADIALYVRAQPEVTSVSNDDLLGVARSLPPWAERMMHHLLGVSAAAGIARAMLERAVAPLDEPGLENRLTAGLGSVESAEPPRELWDLGRVVARSPALTRMFDDGLDGLDGRLHAMNGDAGELLNGLDAFAARHGARGPDEWELASPTWGTDPSIALAMIDRLRGAPEDRDPMVVGARLALERASLTVDTRQRLPWYRRALFDRATRATSAYGAQREATKAAYVRALYPTRLALAELARRAGIEHSDFFLLTMSELPAVMRGNGPSAAETDERRERRDYLQARIPPFWFQGDIPAPATWPSRSQRTQPDAGRRTLSGMGVCSGRATGTARVVLDPTQPGDLRAGDILVAPITDPAWTPLFLAVAGVVVDVGAQQSHAAIVSRELGIPAVVSVTGASTTIPDGAIVTVDGSTGLVTIHEAM